MREGVRAHEPEHRAEALGEVEPTVRLHVLAHARSPGGLIDLLRFNQPNLTELKASECTLKRPAGGCDQRTHDGGKVRGRADLEAAHRVGEAGVEGRIVIDSGVDDRQARGRALLSGVTECALHQILNGLVDVSGRGDDHGVLAAGLGVYPAGGLPRGEQVRRLQAAGEHDQVHVLMGDEALADFVVRGAGQLNEILRDSGAMQRIDEQCADLAGLRGGLEDRSAAGRDRVDQAAERDGVGEVPWAGHDGDGVRLPGQSLLLVFLMLQREVCGEGDEVDALADLRIRLAHGFAHEVGFGGDRLTATLLKDLGHLGEDRPSGRPTGVGPLGLRGLGARDGVVDVPNGFHKRWVDGLVAVEVTVEPLTVGRDSEIGVRDVLEGTIYREARVRGGAVLVASGLVRDSPTLFDRGTESLGLLAPLGASGSDVEQRAQKVLRRGVLIESAREIRDRRITFIVADDR